MNHEQAFLSCILLENAKLDEFYLSGDEFGVPKHRAIYASMKVLRDKKADIDIVSLTDSLGGMDPAYISALSSVVPSAANAKYYYEKIKTEYQRRILHKIGTFITDQIKREPDEIISEVEKKLTGLRIGETDYARVGTFIHEFITDLEARHQNQTAGGLLTHFGNYDSIAGGLWPGDYTIIAARPSVGKTSIALQVALNMSIIDKRPIGFFSAEMARVPLMQKMVASLGNVELNRLRHAISLRPSDFHGVTEAAGRLYEAPFFLDDTPNIRIGELINKSRRMKREGVEAVFIDYIGLITPADLRIKRHEQVSEISRLLKGLARELKIPVVVLCQLNREKEDGKRPGLSNLRESGSLEQDADVVSLMWRDGHDVWMAIAKQRMGPVGEFKLSFEKEYTRFHDIEVQS